MTAKDLIEYLQSVPENTKVSVWIDGKRREISNFDPFEYYEDGTNTSDEPVADINIKSAD